MRRYELVAIFPSEEEAFRQGKETVSALLAKEGAVDIKEDDMGDKPLAYVIKKRERGHYMLYTMSLDPQKVLPIEKAFKLTASILKYLFVRIED